jgi:hypothetical protein
MPLSSLDKYELDDIRRELEQVHGIVALATVATNHAIIDYSKEIGASLGVAQTLLLDTLNRLENALDLEDYYESNKQHGNSH